MSEKTYPIVLNQSNITNATTNASFSYKLPGTASTFKNAELSIGQINMYNSIFNINSTLYNNNTFSIIFPISTAGVDGTFTLNITLPNSYMSYSDINNYVQQQCIANGLYLINGSTNVYFWNIQANPTLYSAQINEFSVPRVSTYAGMGYTLPPSGKYSGVGTALPTTNAYTPQTVIANNGFKNIVGLPAATYPVSQQTSTYSISSSFTPQISPVQSLNVHCSLINSPYTIPSDYLANINPNSVAFGGLYTYMPTNFQWLTIPDQTVNTIRVYFTDQSNNLVYINDPSTTISLLIKVKS